MQLCIDLGEVLQSRIIHFSLHTSDVPALSIASAMVVRWLMVALGDMLSLSLAYLCLFTEWESAEHLL